MAFPITQNAQNAANQINVKPVIVMEIDGLPYRFGSATLVTLIRIGDAGLFINNYLGDPWVIGGYRKLENQFDYISFDRGGAAKITQSLKADRGKGTSVQRLQIALIDKNDEVSEIISPGIVLNEILGRNVKIYQGFENTSFPEDYITIFRGLIEGVDSKPGLISFNLSNVEEKKRQGVFRSRKTQLASAITQASSPTTVTVDDASEFLNAITGPDGTEDSALTFYFKINDEVFSYTGTTGTTFTGVQRAQLGTVAQDHDVEDNVESIVRIEENGINLALKLMLSGTNGFYVENISVTNFEYINPLASVDNAVLVKNIDLKEVYGVAEGDFVTITGSAIGGNNVSASEILEIQIVEEGTYLILDDTLTQEIDSAAEMSIRSAFDTFPEGLGMLPSEVDVEEHVRIFNLFLSGFNFDFRITDMSDAKKFLDEQVYLPMSAFSVPRKGRASLGYTIGPIPGSNIVTLDRSNITNADRLQLSRSLGTNFTNTVRYEYDQNVVNDNFDTVKEYEDSQSKIDIPVGDKSLEISAEGMRTSTSADTLSNAAANRRLKRYGRGAEYLKGVEVQYGTGFNLEIGDVILFDTAALQVTDTETGSRSGSLKFMEIQNKILDNKSGKVILDLTRTAFEVGERYGLISPSSKVKQVTNGQQFVIEKSFFTNLLNEGRKWQDLVGASVIVRNEDSTAISTVGTISAVVGDEIFLESAISPVPVAGRILELATYDNQPDLVKLLYAFFSDGSNNFADGQPPYVFL